MWGFSSGGGKEKEKPGEGESGRNRVAEVGEMEVCMVSTGLVLCLQGQKDLYMSELCIELCLDYIYDLTLVNA